MFVLGVVAALAVLTPFVVRSVTLPNPIWLTVVGISLMAAGLFYSWKVRSCYPWMALLVAVVWSLAITGLSLALCNSASVVFVTVCVE